MEIKSQENLLKASALLLVKWDLQLVHKLNQPQVEHWSPQTPSKSLLQDAVSKVEYHSGCSQTFCASQT